MPLTSDDVDALALLQEVDDVDVTNDPELFDELYNYFFTEMPYGVAKARDGDPYDWITNALADRAKHLLKLQRIAKLTRLITTQGSFDPYV